MATRRSPRTRPSEPDNSIASTMGELRQLMMDVSQRLNGVDRRIETLESTRTAVPALPVLPADNTMPSVLDEPTSRGESRSWVDDHLTAAVRTRVQNGEFVEMESMLLGYGGISSSDGRPSKDGEDKRKVALTLQQWQSAFHVYMSCVIEKHPEEARGLIKYIDNIQRLYDLKSDWLGYDRRFRAHRASLPLVYPWEKLCSDLFLTSMAARPSGLRTSSVKRVNTCFDFNDGACARGTACPFHHKCRQCGSFRHGRLNCPSGRRPVPRSHSDRDDRPTYASSRRAAEEPTRKDRSRK